MLRRVALALALALGLGFAVDNAASAAPSSGPYYKCSEGGAPVYTMVGNALIWVHSWSAFYPAGGKGTVQPPITCADHLQQPEDGTIAQSVANGGVAQATYVVVGGAPLHVTAPAAIGLSAWPSSLSYFDKSSLPPTAGPEQTSSGAAANDLAGYFNAVVRNAYFKSKSGTIYRTDGIGHPSIVSRVPAGWTAPVVDQASINSCERMNCSPWGDITIQPVGEGAIQVSGYALDAMTNSPVTVRLQGAGATYNVLASQPDPSINWGYGVSGNHGFNRVLSVPSGHYDLCTTFVGFPPGGTTTPAGCQVVDVPGSKPGHVHRPKVKARGHGKVLVKWKQPVTHGSPVTIYIVKPSPGKKRRVVGTKHKVLLKHLPVGHGVKVKVRAINGVGAGGFSKKSKMVRVR